MLGVLSRAAWFVAWLAFLPLLAVRQWLARVPRGVYLLVEVDGHVEEPPTEPPPWWSLLPGQRAHRFSLHAFRKLVDQVATDDRVRGLVVVVKSLRAGFATATSFRSVLGRARAAGKHVVVHLPHGGATKAAYAAMAADRTILGPHAVLAPVGVLSSTRYVRTALDRAGVVPEVHARGRFKTAAESFERSAMSDAQREQVGALLDGIHRVVVRAIAEGRDVDEARAEAIVNGAPYTGHEATAAGLVDHVAYEDEIPTCLEAASGRPALCDAPSYARAHRSLMPGALRSPAALAVVRVHGVITSAAGGPPLFPLAIDERIVATVRRARANPLIRGVLLHINSPGGGLIPSARIHHELTLLAQDKPVVACMGDVAASGGYWVASAAHQIVAQPTTITGSIGVVAARLVLEPLLSRLGVETHVLQRGAHARLLDPLLPLGDGEKQVIDRELEHAYKAFLEIVAAGRNRTVEEIEPLAQGRVWLGADAHRHGLVDRLGGFEDALASLRARIGRGAERLRVVALRPPRRSFPMPRDSDRRAAAMIEAIVESIALPSGVGARHALGVDLAPLAFGDEPVLAWCPHAAALRG
jgi:protease-4